MIKFSLEENALDSIQEGMKYLSQATIENNSNYYKKSLLSLFQGAELILKSILVQKDPLSIFYTRSLKKECRDPQNPTINELYNCQSLNIFDISDAISKKYVSSFNSTQIDTFNKLAKERNKIQHFAFNGTVSEIQVNLINLYLDIIKPSLSIIKKDYQSYSNKINKLLFENCLTKTEESFLNSHMPNGFFKNICPNSKCSKDSFFIIYNGESFPTRCYCTSCELKIDDIKIWDYHLCPECNYQSLMYSEELLGGICISNRCYYSDIGEVVDMIQCKENKCDGYLIEKGECTTCSQSI